MCPMSCVPNGSGAGGQASEEPAPARGAAWPGAAGRRAAVGMGQRERPRGPATPISAWPGSADQENGNGSWDGEGRRAWQPPLLIPSGAVLSGCRYIRSVPGHVQPQGTVVVLRGGGSRSETGRSEWNRFSGLASGSSGVPCPLWRKGPWSSQCQSPSAP